MKKPITIIIVMLIIYACTSTIIHVKNQESGYVTIKVSSADSTNIDGSTDVDFSKNKDTIQ